MQLLVTLVWYTVTGYERNTIGCTWSSIGILIYDNSRGKMFTRLVSGLSVSINGFQCVDSSPSLPDVCVKDLGLRIDSTMDRRRMSDSSGRTFQTLVYSEFKFRVYKSNTRSTDTPQ